MVEKPVVEHIVRRQTLPWRPPQDHLTECGLPAASYPSISRAEFDRKVSVQGKQRAAMTTCMTCSNTATRFRSWSVDPLEAVNRELYGMRGDSDRFRVELLALAALVAAHPDEFADLVEGLGRTVDLTARRRAKDLRTR